MFENTYMLAAMKTNYEGNSQESRNEAHGGNIYWLDVSNSSEFIFNSFWDR